MRSLHVFKIPIPYWGSLGETDAVPRERSKERRGKSTFLFQHPVLKSYPSNTGLAGGDDDGVKSLSRVPVFAAPWPVAHQAPLSMGFPRQEYWSGLLKLLGWPEYLFGFFCKNIGKIRMNFVANPIGFFSLWKKQLKRSLTQGIQLWRGTVWLITDVTLLPLIRAEERSDLSYNRRYLFGLDIKNLKKKNSKDCEFLKIWI